MVVYASAIGSMLAGASLAHYFLQPDLTIPSTPPTFPSPPSEPEQSQVAVIAPEGATDQHEQSS